MLTSVMGLGRGSGSGAGSGAGGEGQRWYAVRQGRQTGIFGRLEQAVEQTRGFEGAQMKAFERSEGGVDRGLLQAKMWLRSGSQVATSMPPPDKPASRVPPVPVGPVPSARRFSPMLLDAFHFGFFGDVAGREAALAQELAHAAVEERRQRPAASRTADIAPAAAPRVYERPAPGKVIEPSTVKRAPKRPRTEGKDIGDLYARIYQPPRHRSVLQS